MNNIQGVMLSIQKPYTDMIFSGEKPFEFRTRIVKAVKAGTKLYIYETKNGGGSGKVIGEAETISVFDYLGFDASVTLYKHFVELTGCKEPMLTSPLFAKYKEKIGWTAGNKAIWLRKAVRYENPKELAEFCYISEDVIKHPPQGMCGCKER